MSLKVGNSAFDGKNQHSEEHLQERREYLEQQIMIEREKAKEFLAKKDKQGKFNLNRFNSCSCERMYSTEARSSR
jgi:hypothetical protein